MSFRNSLRKDIRNPISLSLLCEVGKGCQRTLHGSPESWIDLPRTRLPGTQYHFLSGAHRRSPSTGTLRDGVTKQGKAAQAARNPPKWAKGRFFLRVMRIVAPKVCVGGILLALLGCGGEEEWNGVAYPDGSDLLNHHELGVYPSLEQCREAALTYLEEIGSADSGDYECGRNASWITAAAAPDAPSRHLGNWLEPSRPISGLQCLSRTDINLQRARSGSSRLRTEAS